MAICLCIQVVEEGQRLMASYHTGGVVATRVTSFPSPQFLKVSPTLVHVFMIYSHPTHTQCIIQLILRHRLFGILHNNLVLKKFQLGKLLI